MRVFRTLLLCTAALAFAGCDEEGEVGLAPNPPLAFTRFVNAVSDTGAQDWRFVDQVEYSPAGFALDFREFTPYQQTAVGTRPLRVFPTSTDIDVTSTRLVDTTLTLEAGAYYTIAHVGVASDGTNHIVLVQDDIATDIAGFELRVMNLGTGLGAIDVYTTTSASGALDNLDFPNVAYQTTTDYQPFATGSLFLHALPAGQTTPSMAVAEAPEGDEADPEDNETAIGGTEIPGSAILGIFTPGSEPFSSAPQDPGFVIVNESPTVSATATGFAVSEGSFIDDGFEVGQEVKAVGFTNPANNRKAIITALEDFARTGDIDIEVTATGFVRTDGGSFLADGFTPGMAIYATGFTRNQNNGPHTVVAVTVTELAVTGLAVEAEGERSICADPCSTMTVTGTGVAEAASGEAGVGAPVPAWVYLIDRHPR